MEEAATDHDFIPKAGKGVARMKERAGGFASSQGEKSEQEEGH
jgi:hypothetical protein